MSKNYKKIKESLRQMMNSLVRVQKASFASKAKGGISKARQVMAKAAREDNINKQVKKAQESTQRFHNIYFKQDGYANLRTDTAWQKRIIKREAAIFESWEAKFNFNQNEWYQQIFSRYEDPNSATHVPDVYGPYQYFVN